MGQRDPLGARELLTTFILRDNGLCLQAGGPGLGDLFPATMRVLGPSLLGTGEADEAGTTNPEILAGG